MITRDTANCRSAARIVIVSGLALGSWASPTRAQSPGRACGTGTIAGTVRSRGADLPVGGARVTFACGARDVITDSAGSYVLTGAALGRVDVTVHAEGYRPLVATVLVTDTGTVYVDIELTPGPTPQEIIVLDSVHVVGRSVRDSAAGLPLDPVTESDGRRVDAAVISATVLTGEKDVLRALSTDPHMRSVGVPQSPTALADRGGPPDALVVTVDGLPVWSPLHTSGVTAAINPDAVSGVTIHDGAPAARYGGGLSGVVDVTTRDPDTLAAVAGIGTAAARATVAVPFAGGADGAMLSARRSYSGLFPGRADGPADAMGWTDVVSDIRVGTAAGEFTALLVASGDRVAADGIDGNPVGSPNGMGLRSQTIGLLWRRKLGDVEATARAWDAEYSAGIDWTADTLNRHLASRAGSAGAAAELSAAGTEVGASAEQLHTAYRVTGPSARGLLDAGAAPMIVSVFAAHHWSLPDRLALDAGARVAGTEITGPRIEPRLAAAAMPLAGVVIQVGYARMHQFDQSLRNDESPLVTVLGIDLPVAVGTPHLPLAQSDELSAAIGVPVGRGGRLTVDGYDRWLAGLVLVAPATNEPAAMTGFLTGTGRARGMSATLSGGEGPNSRVRWRATYGLGRTTLETTTGLTYHPSYSLGQSGSALLELRLARATTLRVAGVLASDWRTSIATTAVGWEHDPLLGVPSEVVGWSATTTGPLDATRVPMYTRLDAGVEHDWRLGRSGGALSLFGGLSNLLNRRDILGYAAAPTHVGNSGTVLQAVQSPPASLTAGLGWRY